MHHWITYMHHWTDWCITEYIYASLSWLMHHWIYYASFSWLMHHWIYWCIIEYTDASLNIPMHNWIYLCIIEWIYASAGHQLDLCIIEWIYASAGHQLDLCIVEWIYASTLTYLPALYLSSSILSVHVLLLLWVIDDLWMCRHMGWQSQMTYEHVMCCRWLVNASSHWVPDDLGMCRDGCRWLINTSRVVYCELFVAGFIYLCRGWLLNMLWYIVNDLWIRRHVGFSMTYERVVMCVAVS